MDFYETSACTNLNIKEVRAPQPPAALPLWPSPVGWSRQAGGGGEPGSDDETPPLGHIQGRPTHPPPLVSQSFTRLTELVLQAHRKELDGLRTCASNELALAELEEEEGKPEGPANSSKTCWC